MRKIKIKHYYKDSNGETYGIGVFDKDHIVHVYDDGRSIHFDRGGIVYCKNNKWDRVDGPAIQDPDGDKHWYQNGVRHRLDGPAIERVNGDKYYFIEGKNYTEEEYYKALKLISFIE